VLAAENRTHTLSLESNPPALFLPTWIAGWPDLNDSCGHELWLSNLAYRIRLSANIADRNAKSRS
jgi:hypothetical protein